MGIRWGKLIWVAGLFLPLLLSMAPAALAGTTYPVPARPIPSQSPTADVPQYMGGPAVARPVRAPAIPVNSWMAPAPWNNIHNDAYMSDTYTVAGPLGRSPVTWSTWLGTSAADPMGLVVNVSFDSSGNLIGVVIRVHPNFTTSLSLVLLDPQTLDVLAEFALPSDTGTSSLNRPAGSYFYQDAEGLTVIGTADRTLLWVSHAQSASGWEFAKVGEVDLSSAIPTGDKIQALQPDFDGHIWVTSKGGVVCTIDAQTRSLLGVSNDIGELGEGIANSHAAGKEGGVYIASTKALYRFDADEFGRPEVTWRAFYGAGDRIKPGQVDLGTGTTPTLMGGKYVTISDNADPYMHVLVYKRAKRVSGKRLVAKVPVFSPYRGSNENSLIATDRSIVVENNYGYRSPRQDTTGGRTTTPGLVRIDIDKHGKAHKVWTNSTLSIPNAITKLSLQNGLIYTYTKPKGPGTTDRWYFTTVDFRTGKVVWKQLAGTGILYDSDYAGVYLGRDGTFYCGVNGGIVAMRDGG